MRSPNYDPAIMHSISGKRLYELWKRIRRLGCDACFDTYPAFYNWAISDGYTLGDKLHRYDNDAPYSPENCYWSESCNEDMSQTWIDEWCKKWNATVNMIRRHFGLPEF